ncbi:MAG: hypothetical protein OEX19_15775, partial [Gammaproteobacteria bacterium]|nr:hypothetical protein [Gammaproteobacteria bacterium]
MPIIRILLFLTILACLTACLRFDASNENSPDSLAGAPPVVATSLSSNQVKLDRINAGKAADAYIQITRLASKWAKSFDDAEDLYRSLRSGRITLVCTDGGRLTVAGGRRGNTFQISLENRACRTGDRLENGTIRYVYLADSFQREAIEFVDYKIAVSASNTELDGRLSIGNSEGRTDYVLNLAYSDSSRVVYGFDDLRIPFADFNPEKSYEGRITIGESRYFDVNLMARLAFANFDEKAYPVRGAFTLSNGVESLNVTTIDGHQVHLELKDEKENVRLATLEWKDLV